MDNMSSKYDDEVNSLEAYGHEYKFHDEVFQDMENLLKSCYSECPHLFQNKTITNIYLKYDKNFNNFDK